MFKFARLLTLAVCLCGVSALFAQAPVVPATPAVPPPVTPIAPAVVAPVVAPAPSVLPSAATVTHAGFGAGILAILYFIWQYFQGQQAAKASPLIAVAGQPGVTPIAAGIAPGSQHPLLHDAIGAIMPLLNLYLHSTVPTVGAAVAVRAGTAGIGGLLDLIGGAIAGAKSTATATPEAAK
jgi:hypothetical protein